MFKVDIQKIGKISSFGQKEWLEICANIFRDGVAEMKKNASCFKFLFHLKNNKVTFFEIEK